jgi:hypothetical protein
MDHRRPRREKGRLLVVETADERHAAPVGARENWEVSADVMPA